MAEKKKAKNPAAVALANKRMQKISPERRSEIAKIAGDARWAQAKKAGKPRTKEKS